MDDYEDCQDCQWPVFGDCDFSRKDKFNKSQKENDSCCKVNKNHLRHFEKLGVLSCKQEGSDNDKSKIGDPSDSIYQPTCYLFGNFGDHRANLNISQISV